MNNSIALWNGTWLEVDDLKSLLDAAPSPARVRFLFTQCYSGAFARLAAPGTNRCGFVAEAADREVEGCSAAIDMAGYLDYSSHFFAALAGHGRDGDPLPSAPDRDGDGRVTPLEAHYYTLVASASADIPRATSEVLLEQWRPWYLDYVLWLFDAAGKPLGDTRYGALAAELIEDLGIGAEVDVPVRMEQRRRELEQERDRLERVLAQVHQETERVRLVLEAGVLRRWPAAAYPYTLGFARFLEQGLGSTQAFVLAHPDYASLLDGQARYAALSLRQLCNERALVQLEKIEHLIHLSGVRVVFRWLAPAALKVRYEALLACESAPF